MAVPHTAKPATVSSEPALIVEQLGGELNKTNTETLDQLQARLLRHRYALGYYLAATVAQLAWGTLPR